MFPSSVPSFPCPGLVCSRLAWCHLVPPKVTSALSPVLYHQSSQRSPGGWSLNSLVMRGLKNRALPTGLWFLSGSPASLCLCSTRKSYTADYSSGPQSGSDLRVSSPCCRTTVPPPPASPWGLADVSSPGTPSLGFPVPGHLQNRTHCTVLCFCLPHWYAAPSSLPSSFLLEIRSIPY